MKRIKIKKIIITLIIILLFAGGISLLFSRLRGQDAKEIANESRKDKAQDDILGNLNGASQTNYNSNSNDSAVNNTSENTAPQTSSADIAIASTAPVSSDSNPADNNQGLKITDRLVSWGFAKSSSRFIDTIIIHSTYNAVGSDPYSLDDIINKEYKPNDVSPHYIIDRSADIYRLVPDQDIAYHAGASQMPDGRVDVNNFSIGIELVETMSDHPTDSQYAALKNLISYLKGKYNIKYILGHKDIAPGRKTDPWNFDWSRIK